MTYGWEDQRPGWPKMSTHVPGKIMNIFRSKFYDSEATKRPPLEQSVIPMADHFLYHYLELSMNDGPWVAGGCALDWYLKKPTTATGDIDVFFKNQEQYQNFHKGFLEKIKTCAYSTFETENAISYTIRFHDKPIVSRKIQLIKKFFPSPEALLTGFDMNVCQVLTDGFTFKFGPTTEEDIKTKTLRYLSVPKKGSLRRIIKYRLYGYIPCAELDRELEMNKEFYTEENLATHDRDEYEAGI